MGLLFHQATFFILGSLLVFACLAQEQEAPAHVQTHYDVIILGGGSAGMNMAWQLKDNGYSVLVIENQDFVGGHCNTIRFTGPDGKPYWVDAGVSVFPNTSFANSLGYGPWAIDSVAIVERFAGPGSAVTQQFVGTQNYEADFSRGIYYGLFTPNVDFGQVEAALLRLNDLMNTTFKFMDTMVEIPSPIPAELLLTFDQWLTLRDFHVLDWIFNQSINAGGWGPFDKVTAFDAVAQLGPSTLMFDLFPTSWYSIKNGCLSIYEGIVNYIGADAVMLNSHVTQVFRPPEQLHLPIAVSGFQNNRPFVRTCDKLIVAYQQSPEKLAPLGLDELELSVFGSVKLRDYTTSQVSMEGPLVTNNTPFILANVQRDRPLSTPPLPALYNFFKGHPFGPGFAIGLAETVLPDAILDGIMIQESQGCPPEALTKITFEKFWRHEYNPHFSVPVLGQPVNPYTRLDQLQGHRNTFYCGALYQTEFSVGIWNKNKVKLMPFFPPKAK